MENTNKSIEPILYYEFDESKGQSIQDLEKRIADLSGEYQAINVVTAIYNNLAAYFEARLGAEDFEEPEFMFRLRVAIEQEDFNGELTP